MKWNWQLKHWPHFTYDPKGIADLEKRFLQGAGGMFAVLKLLESEKKKQFIVKMLSDEGFKSAEIEGEFLDRESLQSSIQRYLGLKKGKHVGRSEQGMGDLLWKVYTTSDQKLTHEMLFEWHALLMGHVRGLEVGVYRSHEEPMQIVSARYDKRVVFFEAPPSSRVFEEMTAFVKWFNASEEKPALERAAIAHVYFESIHPFEDGNGRLGRALVEKILSQNLGQPTLIAISTVISRRKKEYYAALAACNKTLEIDGWVSFFAEVILEAQEDILELLYFLIAESRIMTRFESRLNSRQEKVLLRMFKEGPKGFDGGLSAENYIAITKTSRPTASRDLADLVKKGVLYKTGQLRYTRYRLNLEP